MGEASADFGQREQISERDYRVSAPISYLVHHSRRREERLVQ